MRECNMKQKVWGLNRVLEGANSDSHQAKRRPFPVRLFLLSFLETSMLERIFYRTFHVYESNH
jgi:hypothetical protein